MMRNLKSLVVIVLSTVMLAGCGMVDSASNMIPASWKHATGNAIEVTAYFKSAAGLFVDNDVQVLGMPVGRVTSIEPQGDQVKVSFTVTDSVAVPQNAVAEIVNTSLITTRHIALSPTYSNGDKLTDGAVIPRERTRTPLELNKVFTTLDDLAVNIGRRGQDAGIGNTVGILSDMTDDNGQTIKDAVASLSASLKVGADNSDAIIDIVKKAESLSSLLIDNYPKMKRLSSTMTDVMDMLARQSPGLVATMTSLNETLNNTADFLASNTNTITGSTARLAALVNNLNDYSRQVVETIDVAPLLFQNLSGLVSKPFRAMRTNAMLDKSILDSKALTTFCQAINLHANGCQTGKLKDFGPDMGVFPALLGLTG